MTNLMTILIRGMPLALSLVLFLPSAITPASADANQGVEIDVHWIDLYQDDDGQRIHMTENVWFNNSGDKPFDGDLFAWLPSNSVQISMCVDDVDSVAICFQSNQEDVNRIRGSPFAENPNNPAAHYISHLSHYGARELINITAMVMNDSVSLPLEIGLGSQAPGEPVSATHNNLSLTSDFSSVWVSQGTNLSIPKYLTVQHDIQLNNSAGQARRVNLSLEGLPAEWTWTSPQLDGDLRVRVTANSTVELTLELLIPNHIIEIEIRYTHTLKLTGDDILQGTFAKRLLYPQQRTEFYVYSLPGSEVEFTSVVFSHYQFYYEPFQRDWFQSFAYELEPDTELWVTISFEGESSEFDWGWALALVIVGLVFSLPLIHRSGILHRSDNDEEDEEEGEDEEEEEEKDVEEDDGDGNEGNKNEVGENEDVEDSDGDGEDDEDHQAKTEDDRR